MNFAQLPIFNLMKSKLDYMSQRQGVLAENVANADTPGFKAKDIKEPDFAKMAGMRNGSTARQLHMAVTASGHMAHGPSNVGELKVTDRKNTYELNPTGNSVVIEEEMGKIGMNQAEYQKVLNLYAKTISMFKAAVGASNG